MASPIQSKSKAMDEALKRYLSKCHPVAKHRSPSLCIISSYHKQALKRFDDIASKTPYADVDLWAEFSNYNPNPTQNGKSKSTAGPTGTNIKAAFREFMVEEQGGKCCYCQRWLVNIAHAKPIEHILPRCTFAHYSFNFWNLALACFDCNHEKGKQVWSDNTKVGLRDYPDASHFTEMFHPRFHDFGDHVRYLRVQTNDCSVAIYIGITDQGRKLCRDILKIISAKEIVISGNPELKNSLDRISRHEAKTSAAANALDAFNSAFADVTKQLFK